MKTRRTIVITPKRDILKISAVAFLLILFLIFSYNHGYLQKLKPILAAIDPEEVLAEAVPWQEKKLLAEIWDRLLGYDPTDAGGQIAANLYFGDKDKLMGVSHIVYREVEEEYYWDSTEAMTNWEEMKEKFGQVHLSDEVGVIIYHTHNAEDYKPSAGASKSEGQNGGVATAADVLCDGLERKYGIKTVHNKTLHDYPDWSHSYINSLKTAKALLNSYPEAKIIFDVHRDAGYTSKNPTTAVINGKKAAKILLVVGGNHENYQQNLAFAQSLEDEGAKMYPDLIKGIHIAQSARYNQQIHPHDIIVEVGSDLNTQEEANYAMECFADICAAVFKQLD